MKINIRTIDGETHAITTDVRSLIHYREFVKEVGYFFVDSNKLVQYDQIVSFQITDAETPAPEHKGAFV